MVKKTRDHFITEARKVHTDRYDYSRVVYTGTYDKVEIVCPIHGGFWQQAGNHIRGYNCPKCMRTAPKDQGWFIPASRKIHGDRTYDYSKVVYVNTETKVEIICPEHGSFWQRPRSHAKDKGRGCPMCGGTVKLSRAEFIKRAQGVHGAGTYNYNKVVYVNYTSKVEIICPEHGSFWQFSHVHLNGGRCSSCSGNKRKDRFAFISEAAGVHGVGTYDYSRVQYVNAKTKVEIVCPAHGSFWQRAGGHIHGYGCPVCSNEKHTSKNEILLRERIKSDYPFLTIKPNYRDHPGLNGLEIDIWLPEIELAIEWNGEFWHSSPVVKERDKYKKDTLGKDLIQIKDPGQKNEEFVTTIYDAKVKGEISRRVKAEHLFS